MRLKLTLYSDNENLISYNYHYHLSSAIYKLLQFGSKDFSAFLHDNGFRLNGKKYKLFTFALRFEKYTNLKNAIRLDVPKAFLFISSPLIDNFIQNFVTGTFESQKIDISSSVHKTVFSIKQVESLPGISFKDEMKFKLLSPVVLSTKKIHNGNVSQYYLRYNDDPEELNRILNENLKNKFEAVTGDSPDGRKVSFSWDTEFIKKAEIKNKKLTKKQTIKEGTPEETEVIGNLIPFTIKGDNDLIKMGYECGFGEKNPMGFGMADLILDSKD
jgi:CRISPR-associated endoribonuclease Cas6